MSKKLLAAVMAVLALVLCGMSIYKDSRLAENADGTIVLRMAQTSSENGAIGQMLCVLMRVCMLQGQKAKFPKS